MTTWYRLQEADRDPGQLLDPESWISRVWDGAEYCTSRCNTCHGTGEVNATCVCSGAGECWVCDDPYAAIPCGNCNGRGEVDDSERRGISVCASVETLIRYFSGRDASLGNTVVVELDGELSEDEDWDAERGAYLVYPSAIRSVRTLTDAERAEISGEVHA